MDDWFWLEEGLKTLRPLVTEWVRTKWPSRGKPPPDQPQDHAIARACLHVGDDAMVVPVPRLNDVGNALIVRVGKDASAFVHANKMVKACVEVRPMLHLGAAYVGSPGGDDVVFLHQAQFHSILNDDEPRSLPHWQRDASLNGKKRLRFIENDRILTPAYQVDRVGRFVRIGFKGVVNLPNQLPCIVHLGTEQMEGQYLVEKYQYKVSRDGDGYVILYRVD